MKNNISILGSLSMVILLASCSGSQPLTSYEDDIYYSPKDNMPTATVADEYIDIDDRSYDDLVSNTESTKSAQEDDYYNPEYREDFRNERKAQAGTRDSRDYYRDDDFYYSNRVRRFNSFNMGFGYYDPFYSYGSWYSYDPFFPRPTFWQPYYQPGFSYGWSSRWGWNVSYSAWGPGWGMGYGYGQPFGWGQPYGWGPYYGGAFGPAYYCPSGVNGGFVSNDIYNRSTNLYTGQFTPYSGSTASNSDLTRGIRQVAHDELYRGVPLSTRPQMDSRPVNAPSSAREERPAMEPIDSRDHPQGQTTRPVEQRPSNPDMQNGTRPVDPNFSRPVQPINERDETPSYVRPQENQVRPRESSPVLTPNYPERPTQDTRPPSESRQPRKRGLFNTNRTPQGNSNDGGSMMNSPNRSVPSPSIRNTPPPSRPSTRPSVRPSSPKKDTGTRDSRGGGRR